MIKKAAILFCLSLGYQASGQVTSRDSVRAEVEWENDTLFDEPIELPELVISKHKFDQQALKDYLILQKRVYKVYPYAKMAADRLTALNANTAKFTDKKDQKRYFKWVEKYLEETFTGQLKKLSRKQGQILVKLICRQTGTTTYDLVKEYKSGWKAFWANKTARVFNINLKTGYAPFQVNEDYLIETILVRAFESGRLAPQVAAKPVNYDALSEYWIARVEKQKAK
jgi:hypothetical protein